MVRRVKPMPTSATTINEIIMVAETGADPSRGSTNARGSAHGAADLCPQNRQMSHTTTTMIGLPRSRVGEHAG